MITRADLLGLDDRRYTDAEGVLAELKRRVVPGKIAREDLPLAFGVTGSSLRMELDYAGAEVLLKRGLVFADELRDHSGAGDIHQRLSVVWSSRLDFTNALEENRRAIARHEDAGNRVGVARSMVDRGTILWGQGHFRWSRDAYLRGLESLPETETRHRFGAYLGIAQNLLETGEVAAAGSYLKSAEENTVDPLAVAKLQWNYGIALSLAGTHKDATHKLWKAVKGLRKLSPIEGSLATIDFAKALLRAGQRTSAHQAVSMMQDFVGPLRGNKAAQAAATQLAIIGSRGKKHEELTLAVLEHARLRVSKAQSRKA